MAFDLTVHLRDSKSGRIIESNPYTRYSNGTTVVYERDGLYYTESGHPASTDLVRQVVGKDVKIENTKLNSKGSKED
jgi:hypothetical protein